MDFKYNHSVLGGTFDHLHKGHRLFIDEAMKNSRKVTIGLSEENLVKEKKLNKVIEDYAMRKESLQKYLKEKGYQKRAKIIPISDFYGNTLKEGKIDVIFSDQKNADKVEIINSKRKDLGYSPLKLVNVPLVLDQEGVPISSTRIRKGNIDPEGNTFINYFKKTLICPENLRDSLRKPFGIVVEDLDNKYFQSSSLVIAVGDIVVASLIETGIEPDISIYDFHTKKKRITNRKVIKYLPKSKLEFSNKPGTINFTTVKTLYDLIEKPKKGTLRIDGEEDLLALPAIVLSPLGSVVVYGLRDKGAVIVDVTLDLKEQIIHKYISKFTS